MIIANISNNTPLNIGMYVNALIASSEVVQLDAPFGLEFSIAFSLPCRNPLNIKISPIIENAVEAMNDHSIFLF